MKYSLEIKKSAEKQLRQLSVDVLQPVNERILALAGNPRPHGCKKLIGGSGWRIRSGDYRVVYEVDDERRVVTICAVKPRQSAYR